jgi:hypothetical protein
MTLPTPIKGADGLMIYPNVHKAVALPASHVQLTVETDPKDSYETGRNGTYDIQALRLWTVGRGVHLDGVSATKAIVLHGGITISEKAMDELARRWLDARKATQ